MCIPFAIRVAERCHRKIKRIAARKCCPIMKTVYTHNITPKDHVLVVTAPANAIYKYRVRIIWIDGVSESIPTEIHGLYQVGDCIWVKPRTIDVLHALRKDALLASSASTLSKLIEFYGT